MRDFCYFCRKIGGDMIDNTLIAYMEEMLRQIYG